MTNKLLFLPYEIRNKTFRNRLIMLPVVTNYANPDGSVSQKIIDYYSLRKNLAAIMVEASYPNSLGKCFENQLGIDSDEKIKGLSSLSHTIHNDSSLSGIQLAMNIKSKTVNDLTLNEISQVKDSFLAASLRAIKSDFDIIEIHCAHGWLLGQFLSKYFNARTDNYGGSLENRLRMPLEIVKQIRDLLKDQLLSVRINALDFIENGITLDESVFFAKQLESIGVDILSVSAGIKTFMHVSGGLYPKGCLLDFAYKIKVNTKIPIIAANRLNDLEIAEESIRKAKADFIGLARSLIADPKIAQKWENDALKEVVTCIGCNQACIANIQSQKEISCMMNPIPYESKVFKPPLMYKRKVMVIGAGPAGLAFSIFAKQKGLNCMLFEKQNRVGGQINLAYIAKGKQEFKKMLNYFKYTIKSLDIPLFTDITVDVDLVKSEKSDVVVFALGSSPIIPPFAKGNSLVLTSDEVLEFGLPHDAKHVGVLGGGLVGLEVANTLADRGVNVSIFEKEGQLLKNVADVIKTPLLESLNPNIRVFLGHKLININNDIVSFEAQKKTIEKTFDYIVLSLGRKSDRELIEKVNFCIDTIDIGDCKTPLCAVSAIKDAYLAAKLI